MKVTLVVLVAVLLFVAWTTWRRNTPRNDDDVQLGMAELAAAAVEMARAKYDATLDYGLESVQQVEGILGGLHDAHLKTPMSLDERRYQAVRYGAYIGEVIRRKWGGRWARDHQVGGKDSLPIRWKTHDSFPIVWCFKRLSNGPEDNVWHKLQVLSSDDYERAARDIKNDPEAH